MPRSFNKYFTVIQRKLNWQDKGFSCTHNTELIGVNVPNPHLYKGLGRTASSIALQEFTVSQLHFSIPYPQYSTAFKFQNANVTETNCFLGNYTASGYILGTFNACPCDSSYFFFNVIIVCVSLLLYKFLFFSSKFSLLCHLCYLSKYLIN